MDKYPLEYKLKEMFKLDVIILPNITMAIYGIHNVITFSVVIGDNMAISIIKDGKVVGSKSLGSNWKDPSLAKHSRIHSSSSKLLL